MPVWRTVAQFAIGNSVDRRYQAAKSTLRGRRSMVYGGIDFSARTGRFHARKGRILKVLA
jgi:hypothetical protein